MPRSHVLAALAPLFACAALATSPAARAADSLFSFDGAIGVDPASSVVASGVATSPVNTVRGIPPGGRAWVMRRLKASIEADGSVKARGAGLLLASGEAVGTIGAVTHVTVTLTCGVATGTVRKFTAAPTPLDAFGRFNLRDVLREEGSTATAVLPDPCVTPVFLVRNANPTTGVAGGWFAVGTASSGRDDD